MTRAQRMLEASQATRCTGSSNVLEQAKKFKVKIIHIETIEEWVQLKVEKLPESRRSDGKDQLSSVNKGNIILLDSNSSCEFESIDIMNAISSHILVYMEK